MPRKPNPLAIDLQHGVVPISEAAGALAALIKRSRTQGQPIIVTQNGYPSAVLLGIELFTALRERAVARTARAQEPPPAEAAPEPPPAPVVEEPAAPARRARGGRKPKVVS